MELQNKEFLEIPSAEHDWITDIELRNIVQSFNQAYPVPEQAIYKAFERKDEITPILLEIIQVVADDPALVGDEEKDFLVAMILLAAFKETKAFEYFIKMALWDEDQAEWLLGDVHLEYFTSFLAATYNGDFSQIRKVIEHKEACLYSRTQALEIPGWLAVHKLVERETIEDYLLTLIRSPLVKQDGYLTGSLIVEVCKLQIHAAREQIPSLYKKGLADPFCISEEGANEYFMKSRAACEEEIKKARSFHFPSTPEGIIKEVAWLYRTPKAEEENDDDDNEEETNDGDDHSLCGDICRYKNKFFYDDEPIAVTKIGRNQKCYCGSGKKYKKCCLMIDEEYKNTEYYL
jgi:hypothetical protein